MLSEQQREWIQQLYDCTLAPDTAADGNSSGTTARVQSLGWAGQALVGVADGKWNEAKDAIERSKYVIGKNEITTLPIFLIRRVVFICPL